MTEPILKSSNEFPKGRITSFDDFAGREVRCVIESPCGRYGHRVSAVIVFEDDCWATLAGESSGSCDDEASVTLGGNRSYPLKDHGITDYLSADDLLRSGMVNHAQFEHIKALEGAAKREHLLKQAERLRAQAEKARADAEKLEASAVSA